MLLLARIAGVVVLVWFYITAKNTGEPPIKWALLGLIGYWLTWWIVNLTVVRGLSGMIHGSFAMAFLIYMIPAITGVVVCVFIRKKLIADAKAEKN
ncbi:MAG: hypothetical protein ACU841_15040 [Gammaproteobacteria bacterium]